MSNRISQILLLIDTYRWGWDGDGKGGCGEGGRGGGSTCEGVNFGGYFGLLHPMFDIYHDRSHGITHP